MDKTCKDLLIDIVWASIYLAGETNPANTQKCEQIIENSVILLSDHGYSKDIVFGRIRELAKSACEIAEMGR